MGDTQQPQPAGTGVTGAEAAAELTEIQRRQEQVIKATLVPAWYWWVDAAAIVAIGAARDSRSPVVNATVIPLAALAMVVLSVVGTPTWRHRVQVSDATQPADGRAAAAIIGMIVLVAAVAITTAATLAAAHYRYPGTIGCAAGAAVLVITGPVVIRYRSRLMLRQARQQRNETPQAGGNTP